MHLKVGLIQPYLRVCMRSKTTCTLLAQCHLDDNLKSKMEIRIKEDDIFMLNRKWKIKMKK